MGSGVLPLAMATKPSKRPEEEAVSSQLSAIGPAGPAARWRASFVEVGQCLQSWRRAELVAARGGSARRRPKPAAMDQAYRAISTGWLNALPRFHLRPIDVVVYHGSQRDLV